MCARISFGREGLYAKMKFLSTVLLLLFQREGEKKRMS